MTISTPRWRSLTCGPLGAPPYIAVLRIRELELAIYQPEYPQRFVELPTQTSCILAGFEPQAHGWAPEPGRLAHRRVPVEVAYKN